MNIFKKISLINRILKLFKELKKHFETTTVTKEIREKVEKLINAAKDLGESLPKFKPEINAIIGIIEKYLKK